MQIKIMMCTMLLCDRKFIKEMITVNSGNVAIINALDSYSLCIVCIPGHGDLGVSAAKMLFTIFTE